MKPVGRAADFGGDRNDSSPARNIVVFMIQHDPRGASPDLI
jgi:hypothetical protein